jgi:hypothetical protein
LAVPIPTGAWAAEAAGTPTTAPRTTRVAVVETATTAVDQRCRGRVNMTDSFENPGATLVVDDNGRELRRCIPLYVEIRKLATYF